jgi:hypothetical protein
MMTLRFPQNPSDRADKGLPAFALLGQLTPAGRRQTIEARPAVVLRGSPLRSNPALILQPVQGRVERPLIGLEHVARQELQSLRDAPAVHRFILEGTEDEEVEGALEEGRAAPPVNHRFTTSS